MMKQLSGPRVVLVVEDDRVEREALSCKLRAEGYFVLAVADGAMALDISYDNPLSLIILDASCFPSSGLDICRQLRSHHETERVPILMIVTNKDEIPSLRREEVHIDDYLVKPFLWEELYACVKTLLRGGGRQRERPRPVRVLLRPSGEMSSEDGQDLVVGDLRIDVAKRRVVRHGQRIEVGSALLFELLVYLVRHRGMVLTREQLLTHVWGYTGTNVNDPIFRTVYVHVHWLRELLEDDPERPQLIQTVRGVGYRFKD